MGTFQFSKGAAGDLEQIAVYTLRTWGEAQTERYLSQLEDCCQSLADNPGMGRSCEHIRPGLRRLEHGKHVLFYREQRVGAVLICRILHERMLPENPFIDYDTATP